MTRAIHWGDDPKLPTWFLVVEDDDGDGLITIQEAEMVEEGES